MNLKKKVITRKIPVLIFIYRMGQLGRMDGYGHIGRKFQVDRKGLIRKIICIREVK